MFPISVKNLYIGKLGIDLRMQGQINGVRIKGCASLDPTTLVGEIFTPIDRSKNCYMPDYYIKGGYWDPQNKSFLINPVGTYNNTLWITGVPLEEDPKDFLLPNVYYNTYKDNHRIYLFQITES